MNLTMPQIKRIIQLSRAGLSDAAVAVVLSVDDPSLEVGSESVRYYRRKFGGVRHLDHGRGLASVATDPSDNFAGVR